MRTFLVILIILIIVGAAIWAVMKYSGAKGSAPSIGGVHDAFIQACKSPPYNNDTDPCENAWIAAQGLGLSTYAQWAKWNCDQGHC